jgi:KDO2-lipid IV(A) lauroyltransferase
MNSSYKVSLVNINICFPDLSETEKLVLARDSIVETIVSGYETLQSWSRPIHQSGDRIFKVENNFLLSQNILASDGLIIVAIHNRSVDMLLKWVNGKTRTTTLYKKVKNKKLDHFVRAQREEGNNKTFETNISGVRQIYKALISKKVVCLAADQVPQDNMGEYIKLFNRDAYTTTLAPSLAIKTNKPVIYFCINSYKSSLLSISIKPSDKDIYNDSKHKLSMNKDIENLININPKDYSWEYKRYKKPPYGVKNPYQGI